MPEWLIVADDLTGANDTAATFAGRGLGTITAITPGFIPPATVWALSSASRALPAMRAAARMRRLLRALPPHAISRVYKKIDSALRGNPAAELRALIEVRGAQRALVCPALPAQQRTVIGGRVFWRGQPIEQSEFGAQIASGQLADVFAPLRAYVPVHMLSLDRIRQAALPDAEPLTLPDDGVWLADAETDDDLAILVRVAQQAGVDILCGSAGLAAAIAADFPATADTLPRPNSGRPWLAVIGSRSPVAVAQVQAAVAAGASLLAPAQHELHTKPHVPVGKPCILSFAGLERQTTQTDAAMRWLVVGLMQSMQPGGLFLSGGDTAALVCAWLGARLIQVVGEVEPGVAWGRLLDGPHAGLAVITKAGSFGRPQLLSSALNWGQTPQ